MDPFKFFLISQQVDYADGYIELMSSLNIETITKIRLLLQFGELFSGTGVRRIGRVVLGRHSSSGPEKEQDEDELF